MNDQSENNEPPIAKVNSQQRYQDLLSIYGGLKNIPKDVSPPNKALIYLANAGALGFIGMAWGDAPWTAFLAFSIFLIICCSLAVWREKNVKTKHTDSNSNRASPP